MKAQRLPNAIEVSIPRRLSGRTFAIPWSASIRAKGLGDWTGFQRLGTVWFTPNPQRENVNMAKQYTSDNYTINLFAAIAGKVQEERPRNGYVKFTNRKAYNRWKKEMQAEGFTTKWETKGKHILGWVVKHT